MKRRMYLVGTALAAVLFAVGIGVPAALAKKASGNSQGTTPAAAVLKCHITLSTVPPPGSASVSQPPSGGLMYGQVHCPSKSFGGGVEAVSFKVPDSGDTIASYAQYFGSGSVHGKFNLAPEEGNGNLSSTSFASSSWVGTVTLTGGTGTLTKANGRKGTLKCTSGDSVHLTCTEKLSLTSL